MESNRRCGLDVRNRENRCSTSGAAGATFRFHIHKSKSRRERCSAGGGAALAQLAGYAAALVKKADRVLASPAQTCSRFLRAKINRYRNLHARFSASAHSQAFEARAVWLAVVEITLC